MITVVGSLNYDLFVEASRFPAPGEAILGGNFRRAPGGKGANQACAIGRLGGAVALIGAAGRDAFGDEMLASLSSAGVDVRAIARRTEVASGVGMIILDASGQNQIVVANGANDTLRAEEILCQQLMFQASCAVLAQLETPLETVAAALRLGRDSGALTVLNPAPYRTLPDEMLALCEWIIPNENEATKLSGVTVQDRASAETAARTIRQRAGAPGSTRQGPNVLITLGADGVWLEATDFVGHIPGFPVKAVDTVGAGDAFIGAFVLRLVEGADARDAARFGCAAAAIAVTRHGAQSGLPTRAEVEAFLSLRASA